jgi:hypothetical protein
MDKRKRNLNKLARNKRVQTELPERGKVPEEREFNFETPVTLARIALVAAGLGGVVLLIVLVIRQRRAYILRKKNRKAEEALKKKREGEKDTLEDSLLSVEEDSERHAREGDYTLAMHSLLLKSLAEYAKREGDKIKISYTSRELLPILPLSKDEDSALRDLVQKVEITYFGNYLPSEKDWLLSKETFDRLISAIRRNKRPAPSSAVSSAISSANSSAASSIMSGKELRP